MTEKYPDVEWDRYFDGYEMLEGYAGLLAREKGYDAIVDESGTEFAERVALADTAITERAETPSKAGVGAGVEKKAEARTRQDLETATDEQLAEEAKSVAKTHAVGLGMGQNEFAGTYVSTEEAGNRYADRAKQVDVVSAAIKNPKIFRHAVEYAGYHEQFLPKDFNPDEMLGTTGNLASPADRAWAESAQKATDALKAEGYDSVYLPESENNEGILVVFDQANVTKAEKAPPAKPAKKPEAEITLTTDDVPTTTKEWAGISDDTYRRELESRKIPLSPMEIKRQVRESDDRRPGGKPNLPTWIKALAKEVPEFAADPVFTVDKDKMMVFQDGGRYKIQPRWFGLDAETLTPGQKIRLDPKAFGIKTPRAMALIKEHESGMTAPQLSETPPARPAIASEPKPKPAPLADAAKDRRRESVRKQLESGQKVAPGLLKEFADEPWPSLGARPLVNPHASALKKDEQLSKQKAWDRKWRRHKGFLYIPKIFRRPPKPELTPEQTRLVEIVNKGIRRARRANPKIREQQRKARKIRTAQAAATYEHLRKKGMDPRQAGHLSTGKLKGPQANYADSYKAMRDELGDLAGMIDKKMDQVFAKKYYEGLALQAAMDKLYNGDYITRGEALLIAKHFPMLAETAYGQISIGDKIYDLIGSLINIPRTTLAGFGEMSGIARQGRPMIQKHPVLGAKFIADYHRAFFSQRATDAMQNALENDPLYDQMVDDGLQIVHHGSTHVPVEERGESYMASPLLSRLPVVGLPFRAAERGFIVPMNVFRASVYTKLYNEAEKAGNPLTRGQRKRMARTINDLSGRSSFGDPERQISKFIQRMSPFLNAAFFAPRFAASRVALPYRALISGPVTSAAGGRVTPEWSEAVGSAASMILTTTAIMGLIGLAAARWWPDADVEMEYDPRSSDFGKIRVNNTRWDLWAGYQQVARFLSQLATGQRKTQGGRIQEIDRADLILRELRYKASPIAGLVVDLLKHHNVQGDPMTMERAWPELYQRTVGLVIQDTLDAFEQDGAGMALATFPAVFYGLSVQSYEKSPTA
ncbi:MAG TPA: hypothetical protein VNA25_17205, partial [Phycisphaerae bacterium]|nr:hypothetical protein [Phycisphaerae bacterium]